MNLKIKSRGAVAQSIFYDSQLRISALRLRHTPVKAHFALLHKKFRSRIFTPKDRKMTPLKCTHSFGPASIYMHAGLMDTEFIHWWFQGTFGDHTQPLRAILTVCLFLFCKTNLSESRSNKTLALPEQTEVLNQWIERKLIRRSQGIMAFILAKFHAYLKTKSIFFRIGRTIPTQTENANEHARQKMLKKHFCVGVPMSRFTGCQSERNNIKSKKLNGEKQDSYYFGAEIWIRDEPPAVIKDYEAKDIFNVDETELYSRTISKETLSFKNSLTAACKMAKKRAYFLLEKAKTPSLSRTRRHFLLIMKQTKFVDNKVYLDGLVE
ncbi:hypothetical protein RF11_09605 [Thelohanellus kitauei]|uniref:DDE-1 domain-containing protein n=1 Tax=Thelohanellus kitauei TaxID=669202 RepID=A0A0C2IK00_THEKT|nr:hypothetical protein RF11_09605 [Thelohanellus kitauei]